MFKNQPIFWFYLLLPASHKTNVRIKSCTGTPVLLCVALLYFVDTAFSSSPRQDPSPVKDYNTEGSDDG